MATQAKKKAEPKAKAKAKAKTKTASKTAKAKAPSKTVKKAKPAAAKSSAKKKAKAPARQHHVKHAAKPAKRAVKAPVKKDKYGMSEEQKAELLNWIDKIVHSRAHKPGGLRSFFMIDRILDHYNQKYTHPETKFDAIVEYGVKKQNGVEGAEVYIMANPREPDEENLYRLMTEINAEKVKFADIKEKLQSILTEAEKK